MIRKEISLSSMSLSEAEQNFIYVHFLNKEKIDELKDAFMRKREQENNQKDLITFNGALSILMEGGYLINDKRKFELVVRCGDSRQACDFKDLLKMMCQVVLSEERQENQEASPEYLDAFVAIGGNKDGSGCVTTVQLEKALEEFGLQIDVSMMLESFDIFEQNVSFELFCKIFDRVIIEENKSVQKEGEVS